MRKGRILPKIAVFLSLLILLSMIFSVTAIAADEPMVFNVPTTPGGEIPSQDTAKSSQPDIVKSPIVSDKSATAQGSQGASNGFARIGQFFKNKEFTNHNVLIDFGVFFLIFFSLCWLGFSKWFGEGFGKPGSSKGAVVGLSLGLSLMFTFGLVISGKFTIAKTFPIAKNILFIAIWLLLYSILANKNMIGDKTWLHKAIAFILAGILVYVLANIATAYICSLENNEADPACQGGIFTAGKHIMSGIADGLGIGSGGGGGTSSTTKKTKKKKPSDDTDPDDEDDKDLTKDVCKDEICRQQGFCPGVSCALAIQQLESWSVGSIWDDSKNFCKALIYGPTKEELEEHEKWRRVAKVCEVYKDPGNDKHSEYLHAWGGYYYYHGGYLQNQNDIEGAIKEFSNSAKISSPYKDKALKSLSDVIGDQFTLIQDQIKIENDKAAQLDREKRYAEAAEIRVGIIDAVGTIMGEAPEE